MDKKHVVILGAGISGLSLAWFLQKKYNDQLKITLIDKSSRVGGWIQTVERNGFLFEQGPRGCRPNGNGTETLKLIQDLSLEDQVITVDTNARKRYLWKDQRLQSLPSGPISLLFSPFAKGILFSLFREWHLPSSLKEDETIYDFIARRFSASIADTFVDPLVSGIFAGDIRKLSVKSCFPSLVRWEQQKGSVLRGLLAAKKETPSEEDPFIKKIQKSSLFSLRAGMELLPRVLEQSLSASFLLGTSIRSLRFLSNHVEISLPNRLIQADHLFSTVSTAAIGQLINTDKEVLQELGAVQSTSVAVVNVGYKHSMTPYRGYGYLIPSKEEEEVLGAVWDSCIFPQQNRSAAETRLSVIMGGDQMKEFSQYSEQDFIEMAMRALKKHMNIQEKPQSIAVKIARDAIPQFYLGHAAKMESLIRRMENVYPRMTLLGTAISGVAVNDCIAYSKKIAALPIGIEDKQR